MSLDPEWFNKDLHLSPVVRCYDDVGNSVLIECSQTAGGYPCHPKESHFTLQGHQGRVTLPKARYPGGGGGGGALPH